MAFVVYDPAEVARAVHAYKLHQRAVSAAVLAEPVVECAVCGRQVDELRRYADVLRSEVVFVVRCHGAEDRFERTEAQVAAGTIERIVAFGNSTGGADG